MVRSDLVLFVRDAVGALRRRPRLAVPFLVAAVVAVVADTLRLGGPVPVRVSTVVSAGWTNVYTQPAPGVVSPVWTTPWATLGLAPASLAWVLAVAGGTALVGAAATTVVIHRAPFGPTVDGSLRRRVAWAAPQIAAFELLVVVAAAALTTAAVNRGILAYGLFAVGTFLGGLTLLTPGALVEGLSLPRALARSVRLTGRQPWTFTVTLLAVAVAANAAVSLPALLGLPLVVGTAVGTLVVGLPFALVVAVAVERIDVE